MEMLGKGILAFVCGIGAYAIVSVIPILQFVSVAFGVLTFLGVGTYLMSRE